MLSPCHSTNIDQGVEVGGGPGARGVCVRKDTHCIMYKYKLWRNGWVCGRGLGMGGQGALIHMWGHGCVKGVWVCKRALVCWLVGGGGLTGEHGFV